MGLWVPLGSAYLGGFPAYFLLQKFTKGEPHFEVVFNSWSFAFLLFFKFFVLHFSFQHFLLSFGRLWPHGLMTLQTIIFITTRHYNLINPWPYDLMNYDFHNHMTLCNCNLIVSWRHNHMKLWYYDLITTWTHN